MTNLTPKEVHEKEVIKKAKKEIKYKKRRKKYGVVVCGWEAVGTEKVYGIQKICARNALVKRNYGVIEFEFCEEHAALWDEVYERAYNWYGTPAESKRAHQSRKSRKRRLAKGSKKTSTSVKRHKRSTGNGLKRTTKGSKNGNS